MSGLEFSMDLEGFTIHPGHFPESWASITAYAEEGDRLDLGCKPDDEIRLKPTVGTWQET